MTNAPINVATAIAITAKKNLVILLGRSQFAAVQPCHVRSNWVVLGLQHALTLRTFECPQNGAGRARFDPGQHHATSATAAAWSLDRDKRWLDAMGTKHCGDALRGPGGDDPSLSDRPRVCVHLSTQSHDAMCGRPRPALSSARVTGNASSEDEGSPNRPAPTSRPDQGHHHHHRDGPPPNRRPFRFAPP